MKLRRVLSFILIAFLILSLSSPVFAEEILESNDIIIEENIEEDNESLESDESAQALITESETEITDEATATIQALSDSQVTNKILALKSTYPEGMKWNNDDTHKTIASNSKGGTSRGCQAFAWKIQDEVYGTTPYYQHNDINAIKPGDFLRVNNDSHAVVVVSRSGDTVEIVEGNYSGKVHWGRKLNLASTNINYIISRGDQSQTNITTLKLNKTTLSLEVGATSPLIATVNPSSVGVTWTSADPSIASVASSGLVTAKKAGITTITATTTDKKVTAECKVTVTAKGVNTSIKVSGVTLSSASKSVAVGDTYTLTATVKPSNAADKSVTWTSSNTSVATVSNAGKVTAKKAGTATITVKTNDGGKTATHKVTVTAKTSGSTVKVTGVSVSPTTKSVTVGDTYTLTATVKPSNASNKAVTWSSSNAAVAAVTSAGKVTAKKAGTATITVKTKDGSKTATHKVTVKAKTSGSTVKVTGVSVSPTSKSVAVGDTYTLTATVKPSNASNKAVTWSSSNAAVATVTSAGKVTAKKAGTATITVKTKDGSKTATHKVTVKASGSSNQTVKAGDVVTFGNYPGTILIKDEALIKKLETAKYDSDNNTTLSGTKYHRLRVGYGDIFEYYAFEPLRWKVLSVDNDGILLMTERVVGEGTFENYKTFANTTFSNIAFNSAEKKDLQKNGVEVSVYNAYYNTTTVYFDGSEKIRPLTEQEATKYMKTDKDRIAYTLPSLFAYHGNKQCSWWLASVNYEGVQKGYIRCVSSDGTFSHWTGYSGDRGYRPVIKVSKSSTNMTKVK